jgi:hypothetical protein
MKDLIIESQLDMVDMVENRMMIITTRHRCVLFTLQ